MKCLICKENNAVIRMGLISDEKLYCSSCYSNTSHTYEFLGKLADEYIRDKIKMTTELKFPEAKDYPDGFNWFAYDENGEGWFYSKKPSRNDESWTNGFSHSKQAYDFCSDENVRNWQETLREKPTTQTNAINPNYYKWHPVCEAVKITQEFTTNLGCVINYIWRVASPDARKYDSKEGRIQDLQKAIRHLEFEIERIKEE